MILSVEKNSIPIYSRPDIKSKVMIKLESGLILKAIEMNNKNDVIFYQVILPSGKFGWVCEHDLLIQKE